MHNITASSFFAGIGGTCLGFKQAGVNVIWANEYDKNACETYRNNIKNTKLIQEDIKNLDIDTIPKTDILIAGFPCQAFSIAGKKGGFNDERGKLFFNLLDIIKLKKNDVIFLENVKNLENHEKGRTLNTILNCLKDAGYFVKYKVLNTMDYGNIPQNRERIYIVGFLKKESYEKFTFPKKVKLTKKINDLINLSEKKEDIFYYKKYKIYDKIKKEIIKHDTIYQWRRKYVRENKSKVCPTLTANMGTGGHNVPLILDDYDIRKLTPEECLIFQGFPKSFKFPKIVSKSEAYKQAGNSVSVPIIKKIAKNIVSAIS
jgi:DNA (cytosine-5)-methyltransferase 1